MNGSLRDEQIRLLNILKNYVKNIEYPLCYSKDYEFYNWNKNFNCYTYALGLRYVDDRFLKNRFLSVCNPGTISSFKYIDYNERNLIEAVMADCELLGINVFPTDIGSKLSNDMTKIAIYIEPKKRGIDRDFHFARLNKNGIWSNMSCCGGAVFTLGREEEDIINIPRYDFIGTFALSKKK